jgi:hypothetical protein
MRKLASLIEGELHRQEICAVYDSQLARVWPRSMSLAKRKQQIERFAKEHDLAVTFYDVGLCAVFQKAGSPARSTKRESLLEDNASKKSRKRRR